MTMFRTAALSAALGGAALLAAPASAAPIELTQLVPTNDKPIVSTTLSGSTRPSRAFAFEMVESQGGTPLTGAQSFFAFCIDLVTPISRIATYDVASTTLGQDARDRIGLFFDANYDEALIGNDTQAEIEYSAAFQLGLWEVVYDSDFSLATGVFRGSSTVGSVESTAASLLTAAQNASSLGTVTYFRANPDDGSQDLVSSGTFSSIVPVPVPAGALLLLTALGGLAAMRRRAAG